MFPKFRILCNPKFIALFACYQLGGKMVMNRVSQGDESVMNRVSQGDESVMNRVSQGDESVMNRVSQGDESVTNHMSQGDKLVESIGTTWQHDDFRRLAQQKYPDTLADGSDFKSPNFVVVGPGPQIKMSYSILSAKMVGIGLRTGTHQSELVRELTTLFSFNANELAIKMEV
ncbi:hypothetical protein BU17DRAFT_64382 [Hysterangium stoloniferum]|nr:hypothetical protein BU17DRAFT_64382 [Hysterangium stoloniferum]